jgi:LysR substrate binding domain
VPIASSRRASRGHKRNFLPSVQSRPAARRVVLEYFSRAGIDLKPEHEVHNVVHAISMITSTRAIMLLPAYTERYLPASIATRPVKGEAPTLDLVIAYHKANKSPILTWNGRRLDSGQQSAGATQKANPWKACLSSTSTVFKRNYVFEFVRRIGFPTVFGQIWKPIRE